MVSCSHMFIEINLKNIKVGQVNLASEYNADEVLKSNKTPEDRLSDGEVKLNNTIENMKALDIYSYCMEVA